MADLVEFAFTDEQEQLRAAVRRFLADRSPEAEVRRWMDTVEGYDPAVWARMAEQLELPGLIIPEEFGGGGFGLVELVVVLEEMGRVLLCAPYLSGVQATTLLLACDDVEARKDLLPGVADGSTIATVALTEASGRWDEPGVTLPASGGGPAGWTLSGEKLYVLDGHTADLVLVAARAPAGVSLFAVERGAAGFSTEPLDTLDRTRKQARLTFADTPARPVGAEGAGWPALSRMLDLAAVALAAEQVGGAQRVLDMAVEYAKVRRQFGRPIGSFQAIKHKCAELLLEVESARSAAYHAGWAAARSIEHGSEDLPAAASLAKAYCSEAYAHAAAENIEIHGGIGFTWEHPAHLYYKRAKSSELLLGDPDHHRELLARRIGL